MLPPHLRPRFTVGGLLAATTVIGAYLTTALYANDPGAQSIAALVIPMLLLVAIITWCEPGRLGTVFTFLKQRICLLLPRRR